MQAFSISKRLEGKRIGFVPTMGYLHDGHLSLVRKAKELSDIVVVSIFVNPTQFAPNEDFSRYPRNEEKDKQLLIDEDVDVLFFPPVEEIYPAGFQTYVEVTDISKKYEGESRPTHFKGVTTIVAILFNSVLPDSAVFGQKDAQQVAVIKRMVDDLKFNLKIITAPIVRENDGLALSSRNVYLSPQERKDALVLNKSLLEAKELIARGEMDASVITKKMNSIIDSVGSSKLDYIRIVDSLSFNEVKGITSGKQYYILIACRIGSTRLIDNILVEV